MVWPLPGGLLAPLPWGPGTNWARNVMAAGGCAVGWKGAEHRMDGPEVIDRDTAMSSFGPVQRRAVRLLGIDAFLQLRSADVPQRTPAG